MNNKSGVIQDESLSLPTYPIAYLGAKNVFMVLSVWTQKWEIKGGHSIKKYKRTLLDVSPTCRIPYAADCEPC